MCVPATRIDSKGFATGSDKVDLASFQLKTAHTRARTHPHSFARAHTHRLENDKTNLISAPRAINLDLLGRQRLIKTPFLWSQVQGRSLKELDSNMRRKDLSAARTIPPYLRVSAVHPRSSPLTWSARGHEVMREGGLSKVLGQSQPLTSRTAYLLPRNFLSRHIDTVIQRGRQV